LIAGSCILLLLFLGSCNGKKGQSNAESNEISDSLQRLKEDSLAKAAKGPSRTGADELFNDFIYNFASDQTLQKQRILFPLLVTENNKRTYIEAKNWKHDYLFIRQKIYSVFFDREKDMDIVNDTSLNSVQVQWLYPKTHLEKQYCFKRIRGVWLLESINYTHMVKTNDEAFLDFYDHFASDSLFQAHRICQPLKFVTTDPNDDFSVIDATIDVNQWFAFKPQLPKVQISNINYGQKDTNSSMTKIVALIGVGNGFSNILHFSKKEGKWNLTKFEDVSI
jgi:hypothetical protein